MSININLKIQKKDLYLLAAIMVFLVGVVYVIAAWDTGKTMFHSAGDIKITIGGTDYSLQEASDTGLFGGASFGVWNDRDGDGNPDTVSEDATYTASTDGIVVAYSAQMDRIIYGYTPAGTLRVRIGNAGYGSAEALTMPVRKGDTWKVTCSGTLSALWWLPRGG